MSKTKVLKVYPQNQVLRANNQFYIVVGGEPIGSGKSERAAWRAALKTVEEEAALRIRFEQLPYFVQDFLCRRHQHKGRKIIYFESDVVEILEKVLQITDKNPVVLQRVEIANKTRQH